MSTLLSETRIRQLMDSQVIENGAANCVEGIKYDFRLGWNVLLPGSRPVDVRNLDEIEKTKIIVPPGSVAFVLTEERINLPKNMKAELSLKRKMGHAGILVLGGFCVDPGYRGRLLFVSFGQK